MKQILFTLIVILAGLGLILNEQAKARDLQANLTLSQRQSKIWQCVALQSTSNYKSLSAESLWSQCIGK